MSRRSTAALILVVAGLGTVAALASPDDVPPSISVSSARITELRRPPGAYSLRLRLVIRDDVEGNPVGYTVVVRRGVVELARKVGTTASGRVSLALRLRPTGAGVGPIRVVVSAIDPAGNKASLTRTFRR